VREIELRDVSFTYGQKPVLNGIDLRVRAGECVALVGRTGSGKSTLVSLLPRFMDPSGGALLINGLDARDASLDSLRALFGIVTQDTFLFNDTIANNISYGDEQDPSPERIEAAARRAQAHEFIVQKPLGYETVVGERGVQLSGGQRQRLAIARALYHDAPVLILDEATSALDNESERAVQQAINAGHGRPHRLRHRPPPVHHPARRPHPGAGGGAHRRAGLARRAARARRGATSTTTTSSSSRRPRPSEPRPRPAPAARNASPDAA
jgi:subfamily B ATP-binding cassette protein MsbA